jgi:rubrerythrin
MTKYQLLLVLYSFLYDEFQKNNDKSESFVELITGIDPYLWTDGKTADPYLYDFFMDFAEKYNITADSSPKEEKELVLSYLSALNDEGWDTSEAVELVKECSDKEWEELSRKLISHKTGKHKCKCCGCYTMEESEGNHEICPVCFWEDDPVQNNDPDYNGGSNKVSLNEAKINFEKYGACTESAVPFVREPNAEELSGIVHETDDSE